MCSSKKRAAVLADSFEIHIPILHDKAAQPFGVGERNTKANWRAEVLHIKNVAAKAQHLDKAVDVLCQQVEGIGSLLRARMVTEAGPEIVWRDHVVPTRQQRNQLTIGMRRRRISVQQQQRRSLARAGFAKEDLPPIYLDRPVVGLLRPDRNRWSLSIGMCGRFCATAGEQPSQRDNHEGG